MPNLTKFNGGDVMNIKPNRNDDGLRIACTRLKRFFSRKRNTSSRRDGNCRDLVEAYEHKHYAMSTADPIEAINFKWNDKG